MNREATPRHRPARRAAGARSSSPHWQESRTAAPAAATAPTACNFDVTNPGPAQDEFLSDTAALAAEVNGMEQALGTGMNYVVLHGAIVTRELFPLEVPGAESHLAAQDLCFPISRHEMDTNPNVPQS